MYVSSVEKTEIETGCPVNVGVTELSSLQIGLIRGETISMVWK